MAEGDHVECPVVGCGYRNVSAAVYTHVTTSTAKELRTQRGLASHVDPVLNAVRAMAVGLHLCTLCSRPCNRGQITTHECIAQLRGSKLVEVLGALGYGAPLQWPPVGGERPIFTARVPRQPPWAPDVAAALARLPVELHCPVSTAPQASLQDMLARMANPYGEPLLARGGRLPPADVELPSVAALVSRAMMRGIVPGVVSLEEMHELARALLPCIALGIVAAVPAVAPPPPPHALPAAAAPLAAPPAGLVGGDQVLVPPQPLLPQPLAAADELAAAQPHPLELAAAAVAPPPLPVGAPPLPPAPPDPPDPLPPAVQQQLVPQAPELGPGAVPVQFGAALVPAAALAGEGEGEPGDAVPLPQQAAAQGLVAALAGEGAAQLAAAAPLLQQAAAQGLVAAPAGVGAVQPAGVAPLAQQAAAQGLAAAPAGGGLAHHAGAAPPPQQAVVAAHAPALALALAGLPDGGPPALEALPVAAQAGVPLAVAAAAPDVEAMERGPWILESKVALVALRDALRSWKAARSGPNAQAALAALRRFESVMASYTRPPNRVDPVALAGRALAGEGDPRAQDLLAEAAEEDPWEAQIVDEAVPGPGQPQPPLVDDGAVQAAGQPAGDFETLLDEARTLNVVMGHISNGDVKKAVTAMLSHGFAALHQGGAAANADIAALFPAAPEGEVIPPLPDGAATYLLTPELVGRVVTKLSRAAGPGRDGVTNTALISFAKHNGVAELAEVLTDIANGDVPELLQPQLLDTRGVALLKGATRADGVRPIGITSRLRYLAAAAVLAGDATVLKAEEMFPLDFGFRRPGGAESLAHLVRGALQKDEKDIVVQLDVRNAYNCATRGKLLEAVATHAPSLLRFAHGVLSRRFVTRFSQRATRTRAAAALELQVSRGVIQGAPESALLYLLLTRSILEDARARYPALVIATIIDGTVVVGKPDLALEAVEYVSTRLQEELRLSCRPDKSTFYCPRPGAELALRQRITALHGVLHTNDSPTALAGVIVGGLPVGTSAYQRHHVAVVAERARARCLTLIRVIRQPALLPRHTDTLAHGCFQVLVLAVPGMLNHVLRGVPPSDTEEAATLVDNVMFITLAAILQIDLAEGMVVRQRAVLELRASLPECLGGLGLQALAESRNAAYLGSLALSAKLLCTHLGGAVAGAVNSLVRADGTAPLVVGLDSAMAWLASPGMAHYGGGQRAADTFTAGHLLRGDFPELSQHTASAARNAKRAERLEGHLRGNTAALTHLQSCRIKSSGAYLRAPLRRFGGGGLNNAAFRAATWLRLHLDLSPRHLRDEADAHMDLAWARRELARVTALYNALRAWNAAQHEHGLATLAHEAATAHLLNAVNADGEVADGGVAAASAAEAVAAARLSQAAATLQARRQALRNAKLVSTLPLQPPDPPPPLACGLCGGASDGGTYHPWKCPGTRPLLSGRHNRVRDALFTAARKNKVAVVMEPLASSLMSVKAGVTGQTLLNAQRRRADLCLTTTAGTTVVDVTVVHGAPDVAAPEPGRATKLAEAAKVTSYGSVFKVEEVNFLPAAWDAAGAPGKGASKLVSLIAAGGVPPPDHVQYAANVRAVRERVSVALWRMQAYILGVWQAGFMQPVKVNASRLRTSQIRGRAEDARRDAFLLRGQVQLMQLVVQAVDASVLEGVGVVLPAA